MIRLIIADDHQIFVDGIKSLINAMEGIEVVGEANDGVDLLDLLSKVGADVVLMDVNMPRMDGIEATSRVQAQYPETKVLILSMHDSSNYIQRLLKAGADGYVLKNTKKEELQEAIVAIYEGQTYYSLEVSQRIMEKLQRKNTLRSRTTTDLTDREKQVLKLLVKELTTNEIAEALFISHHTVESHRKNLIAKLNVRGTSGLVKYAVESGMLDD